MRGAGTILRLACALLGGCDSVLGIHDLTPVDAPPNGPYVTAVLADQPLAYFRFEEPGGVDAIDTIGGAAGTYVGNVQLGAAGAFAESTASAVFDGQNSAVVLGDRFDFTGTMPFTLETWIRPSFAGSFHDIGSRWREPPGRSGYVWWQDGASFGFERDISDAQADLVTYNGLVEDQWTYVVATYDGATMSLYVAGRQVATLATAISTVHVDIAAIIGAANGDSGNSPFDGGLDEYAIYDHALAPERVAAHYMAAGF